MSEREALVQALTRPAYFKGYYIAQPVWEKGLSRNREVAEYRGFTLAAEVSSVGAVLEVWKGSECVHAESSYSLGAAKDGARAWADRSIRLQGVR